MRPIAALLLLGPLTAQAEATPPQVVVLVSGRTGVDRTAAENVAEAVSAGLGANGFAIAASPQAAATKLQLGGVSDTATCSGRADCVALMGKGFAPAVIVGLTVGRVGKKIAVQISAVLPEKPQVIAQSAFVLPKNNLEDPEVRQPVAKFAKVLHAWLDKHPDALAPPEPPPPPPKEEPRVETPPPVVTPPPEAVAPTHPTGPEVSVTAPPSETHRGPVWARVGGTALGVLALGAGGFGAFEGAGAMSDGQGLWNNASATQVGWQQAAGRAQFADIGYGAAAVLAVGAIVLLIVGFKSSPGPAVEGGGSPGLTWDIR